MSQSSPRNDKLSGYSVVDRLLERATDDIDPHQDVWIAGSQGIRYHSHNEDSGLPGCPELLNRGTRVTLRDAIASGRTPCRECEPVLADVFADLRNTPAETDALVRRLLA